MVFACAGIHGTNKKYEARIKQTKNLIRNMSLNLVRNLGLKERAEWSAKMRTKCNNTSKIMN